MSKTKEQICIERGLLTYLGTLAPIFAEAMDEYAKQEAMGFNKFAIGNGWLATISHEVLTNPKSGETITHEKLYQRYLQSKLNQP